jgi:hypothetical protein
MTIEDEVAAVKAAAAKKLRLLRDRERKQQQVVDARMLTLLRQKHSGLAVQLEAEAREQVRVETAQRSTRARTSALPARPACPLPFRCQGHCR